MPVKIVIGLIGTIGSGKDVIAEHLAKKHGFQVIGMGDVVRAAVKEKGLSLERENLQKVSKEFTNKFGMHYWANKISDFIIEHGWEKIVINGIRRVPGYEVYKQRFGDKFHFILVEADSRIRFDRLKLRQRPGDPKVFNEFTKQERNEIALYETFEEAVKLADYKLKNESTVNEAFKQIDSILKQIESN